MCIIRLLEKLPRGSAERKAFLWAIILVLLLGSWICYTLMIQLASGVASYAPLPSNKPTNSVGLKNQQNYPETHSVIDVPPTTMPHQDKQVGPSFDCAKKTILVEQMICADRELARADFDMSELYHGKMGSTQYPEELREEQKKWITEERNVCADISCLRDLYKYRIDVLKNRW